ncbi:nigwaprin-a-like [Vipera latastei]
MKASHGLLLLLGLLFLLTEMPPSMGQLLVKPGWCPRAPPGVTTPCVYKCDGDDECSGDQKCCQYACMKDCMDPVQGPFP